MGADRGRVSLGPWLCCGCLCGSSSGPCVGGAVCQAATQPVVQSIRKDSLRRWAPLAY